MDTLYDYLLDFWLTYVNPALPVPEYIIQALNIVALVFMLAIIFSPLWITFLIIGTINSIRGRGGRYND